MSRILPFTTVYNFRDFGDYPVKAGGRVAAGRLFRSAHLNQLTGNDVARFKALNISTVIDMRYLPERQRQPNNLPEGRDITSLVFEAASGQAELSVAPHEAFLEHDLMTAQDAREYMLGSYTRRPNDAAFQNLVRQSLLHLADTGESALVHCAAGKDRTGTLVALIQSILGVELDAIIEDYMLTMTAIDVDGVLAMAAPQISKRYGRDYNPDMLYPIFSVSEDYLAQSLNAMGDISSYLTNVIGISLGQINAIKAHYLVS
ncbi:MAG: tyrosine-protein phosphatase [Maricaulaceae bacterium]